jgi:hypothetical protein
MKEMQTIEFLPLKIFQQVRWEIKMTAEEFKQRIIDDFRIRECETMDMSEKTYRLCFPTPESLSEFIKASGLHIHINPAQWGGRIMISVHDKIRGDDDC